MQHCRRIDVFLLVGDLATETHHTWSSVQKLVQKCNVASRCLLINEMGKVKKWTLLAHLDKKKQKKQQHSITS